MTHHTGAGWFARTDELRCAISEMRPCNVRGLFEGTVYLLVGGLAMAVLVSTLDPTERHTFAREGALLDTTTAVLYLAAAGLFASSAWRLGRGGWLRWGYALLFFLVCGEEVSWGQHILGFEPPASVSDMNHQKELNIHNLKCIHHYQREIGILVVLVIGILIPLFTILSPAFKRLGARLCMPVFPMKASGVIMIGIILILCSRIGVVFDRPQDHVIFARDETAEFILGVAFFWFGVTVFLDRGAHDAISIAKDAGD